MMAFCFIVKTRNAVVISPWVEDVIDDLNE